MTAPALPASGSRWRIGRPGLMAAAAGSVLLAVAAAGVVSVFEGRSGSERAPAVAGVAAAEGAAKAKRAYGKLPLRFEPNRGQTASQVKFLARGAGYGLFFTQREAVLSLTKTGPPASGGDSPSARAAEAKESATATVRIRPVGANPNPRITAGERQSGQSNYLTGGDSGKRLTGLPGYGRVSYRGVYPGIDLVYYGNQRKLEYDFVLAPRADPDRIALDIKGAEKLSLDRRGGLVLHTAAGAVRQERPFIYQKVGNAKRQVEGRYVLQGKERVGFSLGAYDRARPLVIDPVLAYSTQEGGTKGESAAAVAVANGCASDCEAYITGATTSTDFPVKGDGGDPVQGAWGGYNTVNVTQADAYVMKLDASGELKYSTYLGGSDPDRSFASAVDASGSAYITGWTSSGGYYHDAPCQPNCREYPTTSDRMQGFGGGVTDTFVTKLHPSGSSLLYSTFLGGVSYDQGAGIALAPGCHSACQAYGFRLGLWRFMHGRRTSRPWVLFPSSPSSCLG